MADFINRDSENLPIVTRVGGSDGINIAYSQNSAGEGVYSVSVNETWLSDQIVANTNVRLSDADSDRLAAVERLLGLDSANGATTPVASSNVKNITVAASVVRTTVDTLITWTLKNADNGVAATRSFTVGSGVTANQMAQMIYYRLLDAPMSTYTANVMWSNATVMLTLAERYEDFTISLETANTADGVTFTVS